MRAIVCGACGRMGRVLRQMINEALDWTLAAGVDPYGQTPDVLPSLDGCPEADVIIDFSHHSGTNALLAYAVERKLPVVIATTGHTPEELAAIAEAAKKIPVFRSGNMSVGVALLCSLAKKAASVFPEADIEIVETHHNHKLDAPSGTAITLAKDIIEELDRKDDWRLMKKGTRIGKGIIPITAVREGEVAGIHEVVYDSEIDTITLRHAAKSRKGLALGAVLAAEYLEDKHGYFTMKDLLKVES